VTVRRQAPAWSKSLRVTNNLSVQTYGIPRWAKVLHVIGGSFLALIGVGVALHPGNTGHPGTAPGYIAFGIVVTALCVLVVTGQLTSRLVVTADGLTWRVMLRTRSIAWADVHDVLVVASSGGWYSPGVKTDGKLIRIKAVIGSRRYAERIVTAIRDARPRSETVVPPGAGGR
jgi:hypothetical protein